MSHQGHKEVQEGRILNRLEFLHRNTRRNRTRHLNAYRNCYGLNNMFSLLWRSKKLLQEDRCRSEYQLRTH